MNNVTRCSAIEILELANKYINELEKDKARLDYLDSLSGEYGGRIKLRMSTTGRGWRLHETSKFGSSLSVRRAIDTYMADQEAK